MPGLSEPQWEQLYVASHVCYEGNRHGVYEQCQLQGKMVCVQIPYQGTLSSAHRVICTSQIEFLLLKILYLSRSCDNIQTYHVHDVTSPRQDISVQYTTCTTVFHHSVTITWAHDSASRSPYGLLCETGLTHT